MALADADKIAYKPKTLSYQEAAGLPLVGVSAWQALVENIALAKGQKILIHGGAGGIGSIAIQLAKHIGAFVATTAKANDMQFVKELGADEVIDYQAQNFEELLHDSRRPDIFQVIQGAEERRHHRVDARAAKPTADGAVWR
jgi:alcohol dehydrogenase